MKFIFLLFAFATLSNNSKSQTVTKERVEKAKRSIGRISMDNSTSTGTGFFINAEGNVVTCWHVIQPAIITDAKGGLADVGRIFIEMISGEKIELAIPTAYFFNIELNQQAVGTDYCLLTPVTKLKNKASFLKLGNFDHINEGDDIYTVGYPLGMTNQFISKGMLSTKYTDSIPINNGPTFLRNIPRSVALLDLTINKGNSGGPIIKFGATPNEDEVIGIADFLINPFGGNAEQLIREIDERKIDMKIQDERGNLLPLTEILKMFSSAIAYSSNGISGCVSINHFLQAPK